MEVLILCAGYGTRIKTSIGNMPKPLVEVAGKPIITHIIEKLENIQEVRRVHVVTNELYFNDFLNWRETIQKSSRITVRIINDKTRTEEARLGSLGDIYYTVEKEYMQAPLLIIAGDNLFDFSLQPLIQDCKARRAAIVSLYQPEDREILKKLGSAVIDESSKIISFEEKSQDPNPESLAATAIYMFTQETLNDLRQYVQESNDLDKLGNFFVWLHQKKPVYGHVCRGKFFDIGNPESLEEAKEAFS